MTLSPSEDKLFDNPINSSMILQLLTPSLLMSMGIPSHSAEMQSYLPSIVKDVSLTIEEYSLLHDIRQQSNAVAMR